MKETLVELNNLKTCFQFENNLVPSVDGVSFKIKKGEILGLVGESGSGKSVTSLSILRLIESPGKIVEGKIQYKDKDLLDLSESEMRQIRGKEIAMVFQEPLTSLNPVMKIGKQIEEAISNHTSISKKDLKLRSIELLKKVQIARPESVYNIYPHELSGGMRQRVMIAVSFASNPNLIIADEPTTALDVTIQNQILNLLFEYKNNNNSVLLITHDLGVIAEIADRVLVMYAGQIVEESDVYELFDNPNHPYTKALIESIPTLEKSNKELNCIEGSVPNPESMPSGCKFHPRCRYAKKECKLNTPELKYVEEGRSARCLMFDDKFKKLWE